MRYDLVKREGSEQSSSVQINDLNMRPAMHFVLLTWISPPVLDTINLSVLSWETPPLRNGVQYQIPTTYLGTGDTHD